MHKIDLGNAENIHFIGIGGSSMSGLAEILSQDGYRVSGSDNKASAVTDRLKKLGMDVKIPNAGENIQEAYDLVVYTAAIRPDNPEYIATRKWGIPMMVRAELLEAILRGYSRVVCVAGSHGKTTTTALLTGVAVEGGLDPTMNMGGVMGNGANFRVGKSPCFILEACEYSNSFLHWHSYIGAILNIDADHIDFYGGMDGLIDSFARFARNIAPEGALVINAETRGYDRIVQGLPCRVISFGCGGEYYPENIVFHADGKPSFDVMRTGQRLARVNLPLHGAYNIANALACFALAELLGVTTEKITRGLEEAQGVKRRFEYKGTFNGADIIDDYAHHPTEVRACLAAARQGHKGRVFCLFQPHLYSRTRDLMNEFATAFGDADIILLLPIYAAREPFDPNVTSVMLGERLRENGKDVKCFDDFYTAEQFLRATIVQGDLLITMGAGESHLVGERLL
ncbi:MAG: UDP-N-acetylmuramate--L-alanine ligase [Defluviitaleaceae bacterium]|nr:UDP-N-acetylmuramate--L-alanine ligase [Defluviitaleaceae bacterium]MCL2239609.1 UDP-N-acetylmuramate--L-alanine ligase [Defluviitaleaceae bacterium]